MKWYEAPIEDLYESALAYCAADEDGRLERYLCEMRRCNQAVCRIRREFVRRTLVNGRRK